MADEHVIFKFGGDTTGVNRALRTINNDVRNMAEKTTSSLKGMFQSLRGGLLAGGLLNVFGIVDSVTDSVTRFAERGKELGRFWGAFSVGGAKAVQQMEDANQAIERQWENTKKLRREREEREKTEKDINEKIRDIAFERASDEEKINTLSRERDKIVSKMAKTEEFTSAHRKLELDLLNKENEIYKLNASMAEKKAKAEEKAKKELSEQQQLQQNVFSANRELNTARSDRFKLTLGELANLNTPEGASAKRAMDLQAQAEQARLSGNAADASRLSAQADAIIRGTGGKETAETIRLRKRAELAEAGGFRGFSDQLINKRDQLMFGLLGLKSGEKADPMQQLRDGLKEALEEYAKANGGALPVGIRDVKVRE